MQRLARHHARMECRLSPTRRWLWRERPGGVSWGLRIQRAGCSRRFRAAAPRARAGAQGSLTGEEGRLPCRAQPQFLTSNSSSRTLAEEAAGRRPRAETVVMMEVVKEAIVVADHVRPRPRASIPESPSAPFP